MHRKQLVIFILMKWPSPETTDSNCGPNTVGVPPCVDACPPSCVDPNSQVCPRICILAGCVCQEGFIRTTDRFSRCISESECPRNETEPVECGPHEVPTDCYTTCVNACNRQGPINCPLITCGTPGCFCAEGYIRLDWQNANSPCIPISKCPCNKNNKKN